MYIEKEGEMAFQERKGGLSPDAEQADVQNGGSRVWYKRWAGANLLGFESSLPLTWQCDLRQVTQCLSLILLTY